MKLTEILLPREKIFFELLEIESNNVMRGAQAFRDAILHYESLPEKRGQMRDIEHRGDEIVHQIPPERLLFEAPNRPQQTWFIKKFGSNVNLGNIPPDEVIPVETLRLGLRGDTVLDFH